MAGRGLNVSFLRAGAALNVTVEVLGSLGGFWVNFWKVQTWLKHFLPVSHSSLHFDVLFFPSVSDGERTGGVGGALQGTFLLISDGKEPLVG